MQKSLVSQSFFAQELCGQSNLTPSPFGVILTNCSLSFFSGVHKYRVIFLPLQRNIPDTQIVVGMHARKNVSVQAADASILQSGL